MIDELFHLLPMSFGYVMPISFFVRKKTPHFSGETETQGIKFEE